MTNKNVYDAILTIKRSKTLAEAREQIRCSVLPGFYGRTSYCYLRDEVIKKLPHGTKIALFPNNIDTTYILNILNSHGYKIDTLLPENAPNYKYDGYDFIITTKEDYTVSSLLLNRKTKYIKPDYTVDKNKVVHVKNFDFFCIYITQDDDYYVSSMKDKTIVKRANCYLGEKFFTDRGFYLYKVYDFATLLPTVYKNYVRIYKNNSSKINF